MAARQDVSIAAVVIIEVESSDFSVKNHVRLVTENNEIKPPSWSCYDVHLCSLKILFVMYFITDYIIKVISRKHVFKALFITYPIIKVLLLVC